MTTHVAILGIDGSGKSTVARALPPLAAARLGVRAATAGATFAVSEPGQDLASGGVAARGLPLAARLAPALRRLAKRCAALAWLYPIVKLLQMLVQDLAARRVARRYRADVVFCDGHALLCAAGRWANYPGGGSAARVVELLAFARGGPMPAGAGLRERLRLRALRLALRCGRALGLDVAWLPDVAVFLDVPPAAALDRIARRGAPRDPHENARDMALARDGYLEALYALERGGALDVRVIASGALGPGETCGRVLDALADRLGAARGARAAADEPLGTTEATRRAIWKRVLRPEYLAYVVGDLRHGAWREPWFLASRHGRALLREGYSAGVMRRIYDQDRRRPGLLDRIFLGYPLHRAVHDRLHLLVDVLERELVSRLGQARGVRVLSAPCGTAEDLFRALERVAARGRVAMSRVHVVAADLDPHGELREAIRQRAGALGVSVEFVRCDLTDPASRERLGAAPFDLALFVGLSSWIDKPSLLAHLAWLRGAVRPSGVLVTDCFSAASYARSGWMAGYRASYYAPAVYAALLDACGFDAAAAQPASGRDRINHVLVVRPRPPERVAAAA
ncbi:MAG TPA: hypothetical protein VFL83_11970 [Anaeromyxobacter sp.]|nr:hypothetical protein [Anaeromyxobacter sp.]